MTTRNANRSIIFLVLAASLTACGGGGGGGGVKSDPPPPPPPPPAPKCQDADAINVGGDLPCRFRYNGERDNILVPVNADLAHAEGFTGKNIKIGVMDDARVDGYKPLEGAIDWERSYLSADAGAPANPGHGTVVAANAVGRPSAGFSGGVAPDARLYYAAVCDAAGCHANKASSAIGDMAQQGVRIFSASYGGTSGNGLDVAQSQANAYWYRPLIAADGLLVSSAGNDNGQQPGPIAGMPAVDANFVGRTIVATAGVVDSKGKVNELASYANRCGYSAEWCITTPGLIRQPALAGTPYQNGSQGTSNAAPIVAGAAALVLEAFPWMSARNLQQTILTTATDIGAPGVDDVFGWGLLNAYKAVFGPAQFQGFDFIANVDSGHYTFANDITGNRGITKDGSGTLNLAGVNSFTGATVVLGGALVAKGGLGGSVAVHDGATLTTGGRIGGDFIAHDGATTAIAIGKPIDVAGTATLAGGVRLLAPADGYEIGSTESLLSAESVTGTFDSVQAGSGFFYSATLLSLKFQVQRPHIGSLPCPEPTIT